MKRLIAIILCFICYGGSICYAQDIVKKLKEEEDGFKWYELTKDYTYNGAEDINGKTLIPLSENFDIIWYKEGYFDCKRTMKKGKKIKTLSLAIYDKYGKLIIAPGRYDYAHIRSTKSIPQYFDVKISKKKVGICDLNGNEIIAPGRYDQVYLETYYGIPEYYKVIKNKKDGICDLNGVEIISPQYKSIITSYSDKGLAFETQIKKKFVTIKTIPIDLSKYYKRGLQLEEQGEISDASHVFETCALYGKYSPAQVKFGEILLYHKRKLSIDQNYELQEAFRWFQKAAVQGDENGQYYMGYCYENGKGTSQSMVRAKEWYEKAANQGNTYAKERLLAINPTDANAQNDLGVKFYNENKDYSEAIKWFKKAAAQGHKYAEYNMGLCYEYGNGTTKNKQEALAWYKKAKNHGHPDAAKRIAELTKPATVAKAPTNTTPKNVTPRNTAPRNDVAYLDVLRQYEGRSRIPDLGPYVRSERDEHSTQVIYRFYNEKGWQKYVAIGKCVYYHGSGKCSGFHFGFCPLCGNSGKCRYCGGNGTSLRIAAYGPNGFYSEDGIFHPSNSGSPNVSVPSSGSGFSNGSSNRSSSSSVHTKCNTCNGTGVCKYCHGKCGEWTDIGTYTGTNTKKWSNCVSCNGSGKCSICYGRGKL